MWNFGSCAAAEKFAGYLGLRPGEESSGNSEHKTKITKAGNRHLRKLAVETANSYRRGTIGKKSVELKNRQKDMPAEVISYAEKATERCQRKYSRMILRGKEANKAVTAIARELCCFIWGMATSHYDVSSERTKALPQTVKGELDL